MALKSLIPICSNNTPPHCDGAMPNYIVQTCPPASPAPHTWRPARSPVHQELRIKLAGVSAEAPLALPRRQPAHHAGGAPGCAAAAVVLCSQASDRGGVHYCLVLAVLACECSDWMQGLGGGQGHLLQQLEGNDLTWPPGVTHGSLKWHPHHSCAARHLNLLPLPSAHPP